MDDLISRQAAIDAAEKETQVDGAYGYMDTKSIIDMLESLPTVQPKNGKWVRIVKHHKDAEQEYSYNEISCSECGAIRKIGWRDARFCPNCGAKMVNNDG